MAYSRSKYNIICTIALFVVMSSALLSVYSTNGVGWDFLSHYLNGRTFASSYFYTHISSVITKVPETITIGGAAHTIMVTPALIVAKGIYFDQVWEPLPSLIIAVFVVLLSKFALAIYLIFLLVLLFSGSYFAASKLDVDPLLLSSIMVAPFILRYTILYNGAEILALGLFLFAIGYAVKGDSKSGIFIGLMGLAKYESLIVSPILFLLGKRKNVIKSIAFALIVTAPWLIFNMIFFGNPLQSYFIQLAETQFQGSSLLSFVSVTSSIIWYPAIITIVAVSIIGYYERNRLRSGKNHFVDYISNLRNSRAMLIVIASIILAFAGFVFSFDKTSGVIRMGYQFYGAFGILAAITLSSVSIKTESVSSRIKIGRIIPYVVFVITLLLLISVYYSWYSMRFNLLGSLGFRHTEYPAAVNALQNHDLANCEVVSNAWPYLNYYNVTSYSPYSCNSLIKKMPIVIFKNEGVKDYCNGTTENIANISKVFNYPNFSIYLPDNYICVK